MASLRTVFLDLLPRDLDARRSVVFAGGMGLLAVAFIAVFASVWHVLAVVATVIFFVVILRRPRGILTFLAIWIPLEPFLLKFVPDDLYLYARYFSEGLIYLLALVIITRILLGEKKIKQTPLDLPFVLFLVTLAASVIVNFVPLPIAFLGSRQILRFIILGFVVVYLYPPRDYIHNLTRMLFIVVILESVLGIAQAVFGGALDSFLLPTGHKFFEAIQLTTGVTQFWDPGSRVFGTLGRYDQLGTFLAFFLLLAVGLLYQRPVRVRHPELWLVPIVAIPALILTFSRSSWFGFLLGLLVIGILFMRDRRVIAGLILSIGLLFGVLAFSGIVVPALTEETGRQTAAERFFEAFSFERWRGEYYGIGRLYWIVQTPLRVVASAPIFGVGPGQFGGGAAAALGNSRVYDRLGLPFGVYGTEGYIDNSWFSLWGEVGTLGLICYLWIFLALLRTAIITYRRSKDPLARGLSLGFIGCLAAIALHAFLASFLEVRTLALYLWMYGGFIIVLGRREKLV